MKIPNATELEKILKTAVQACDIGQKILQDYFGRISDINEKELAGLVSEADIESEKAITQYLRREYPDFDILGEEGAFKDPSSQSRLKQPGRWCIDPLDGTTNYVHQLPIYCVSIGFEWEGETVAGAIHVPFLNKVYSGYKGGGAFVNGKRMKVSQRETIEKSLLATGFSSYDKAALEKQIKIFTHLVGRARGVRRAGSAAYDLCLVAEGVFDGYWESRLQPWDTSAGSLFVREAGGVVTNYQGDDYRSEMPSLIAGNRAIYAEIKRTIEGV
jgi:myo-inositol-1(or 4)-monophosphatase